MNIIYSFIENFNPTEANDIQHLRSVLLVMGTFKVCLQKLWNKEREIQIPDPEGLIMKSISEQTRPAC